MPNLATTKVVVPDPFRRISRRLVSLATQAAILAAIIAGAALAWPARTAFAGGEPGPAPARRPAPVSALPAPSTELTLTTYLPSLLLPGLPMAWPVTSTVVIDTYAWEQALVPSLPGDACYPYPHLDHNRVGPPSPRQYTLVVLENRYVRIAVLPAIGGRILSWEDKTTGRTLTYANPVIKPTRWGYRGWWFATGGLEWAFPVQEHGLNEWRPWQYEPLAGNGWAGVRVWDRDDRTGLVVTVTLRLDDARSDLSIQPRISNPTSAAQSFQFWINAMLTLSDGNAPSQALHFWMPTDEMIVHSRSDRWCPDASPGCFPRPTQPVGWPVAGSRDLSRYATWAGYLGMFATQLVGAEGAYDEASDQGVVRIYPPDTAHGVKLFCLGELKPDLYTVDQSAYFELWGGLNRTFWPEDDVSLPPGASVTWEERWYPVHGIGGLGWANGDLAASLQVTQTGVLVGLHVPAQAQAQLVLRHDGQPVAEWDAQAGPAEPWRAVAPLGSNGLTGWDLQVWQRGVLQAVVAGAVR